MAKMIHDSDVDLSPILSRRVAIMGYGSQGHAHALNLKDSGADVRVGVRPGSRGWKAAEAGRLRAARSGARPRSGPT